MNDAAKNEFRWNRDYSGISLSISSNTVQRGTILSGGFWTYANPNSGQVSRGVLPEVVTRGATTLLMRERFDLGCSEFIGEMDRSGRKTWNSFSFFITRWTGGGDWLLWRKPSFLGIL